MAGLPVDYLAQKMEDIIGKEATLYGEARLQVEEIKKELMSMRSFLEDADDDPEGTKSKARQTQIAQVRDLVYDVEDIIDKFMYHINKWRGKNTFVQYLRRPFAFPRFYWERRQIGTRLRKLNEMIKAIHERYQRFTSDQRQGSALSSPHGGGGGGGVFNPEIALFLSEDDLVGIEAPKRELVGFLTNGDLQRTTISVLGMGGSGKTTLVANLFNSPFVKQKFDCCAWITVSQTFNIEELFRSLIKEINRSDETGGGIQIDNDLSAMSYRDLLEKLVAYLEHKSYFVVLDDVWTADVWSQIKVSLPNSQKGSRVILTTRNEPIALQSASELGSHVYNVKPLDKEKAWDLFCRRAFSSTRSKACPPELQTIADEFMEKCKGLPLAIASVGGLLALKRRTIGEWMTVLKNLQWELSNDPMLQPVKSILLLSYNDLPYHLKCCFLYFAIFPEDHKIWCDRLIKLWMAEGFVEPGVNGVSPEEVGMRYIKELIGRNLFQAASWEMYGDHGKCRMHDMYRELALTISKEENFCSVYDVPFTQDNKSNHGRRVSIHRASNESEVISLLKGMRRLRSFFLFAKVRPLSLSKLHWSRNRLLRVMDMESAPVEELSYDMDVLLNLKYLNLSNTMLKKLPKTVGKLRSLESLDIGNTDIESLPNEVVKWKNLRHLFAGRLNFGRLLEYNKLKGVRVPPGADISSLKNLQTLRLVEASGEIVKQLRRMTQLVQLGITNIEGRAQMEDLCSSLRDMVLLRWLVVIASKEDELLQMDSLNEPSSSNSTLLQLLGYLILCGKLNSFPEWISSLQSLTTIRLIWSRLPVEEDPVVHLQGMNSLRNVWLHNAYQGTELKFIKGFNNLRALALGNLPMLEKLTIGEEEEVVMPDLGIILIRDCPNLKMISAGIRRLSKLDELRLEDVSSELVEQIRGPDRANFRHIPLITCKYYSPNGNYISERIVLG
ncbi:Disease resistance protein RPM1 [Linum grandiflorum]